MFRKTGMILVLVLWMIYGGCAVAQDIDKTEKPTRTKDKKEKKEKKKWDEDIKETAYFGDAALDYTDRTYDDNIKTVLIHSSGSELEPPIINLNGTETIVLRFDDLGENVRDMYYSFEHCTHDWQPSDLLQMDYQQGYKSDIINDYEFSFNTVKKYTHYRLEFPNERIQLTRSGNYVIKVFSNSNPDNLILTARFMVVEPMARIDYVVRNSSVVADRERRQEIDLEVNLGALESMNPYAEIELVALQNFRWDNAKRDVNPSFIKDKVLTYNYQDEITFDGTNEFRFFDAKSLRYRSERIREVRLEENGYHIYLSPDVLRAFQRYTFQNDINGRFLIKNDDMENSHLESDYVWVHFEVPVDAPLGNGNMHIFGQLSNWNFDKNYRMVYNPERMQYEKSLIIKQGYYNYMYIWQYAKGEKADTYLTEGNHAQTENEYLILVYYKDPSFFSDRLVGFKKFSTVADQ
jgi:hypothetical protein